MIDPTSPEPRRRITGIATRLAAGGVILAALTAGTAALHWRADASTIADANVPLPVQAVRVAAAGTYSVKDRYTGRLEPARRAALAFERGGLVTDVLVDEGDDVAAGDVVARLDTAVLRAEQDTLRAERAQVAANLELARVTAARQATLHQQGHASAQRLDEARLRVAALEAQQASVSARILRLEVDIAKSTITAPFAGTMAARHIDEGTVVGAGTAIADLLETGRPQLRIGVSPDVGQAITDGSQVRVTGPSGAPMAVSLAAVRPDIDPATRTRTVLFDVEQRPSSAFGDIVHLLVDRDVPVAGFWLPLDALSEGHRGLWSALVVRRTDTGHTVERTAVEVIHTDDARAFVRGGLADGDQVVIGGSERVVPGQAVTVVETGAVLAQGGGQ